MRRAADAGPESGWGSVRRAQAARHISSCTSCGVRPMEMLGAPRDRITSSQRNRFRAEMPAPRSGIFPTGVVEIRLESSVSGLRPIRSRTGPGTPVASVASAAHADVGALPAHAARRPGRRRGRQPPAARPGRATSAGSRRASTRGCRSGTGCCARSSRSSARRWTRPAPRRRVAADHPAARALGAQRPRRGRTAPLMFRLAGPQGDRLLPRRRRRRRSSRRSSRRSTRSLPRPAREPVPDQLEVPRRAAAPLRRCCAAASS